MKYNNSQTGFTLIEVLVASVIIIVIVGVFSLFATSFFQTYQFSFDKNMAVAEAQDSLRRITRLIREARTSEIGSYPLVTANDQEIIFYGDYDNDGTAERIRFFLSGTTLKQGIIEPVGTPPDYPVESETVQILSDHIRNNATPLFYYYNGDWPGDTQNNPLAPSDRLLKTRLVTFRLLIGITPDSDNIELSSSAQMRNLKNNL